MFQAFVLAALTMGGVVTVSDVFALAVLPGIVNAFDLPTRQSFIVELVDRKDLINAINKVEARKDLTQPCPTSLFLCLFSLALVLWLQPNVVKGAGRQQQTNALLTGGAQCAQSHFSAG